MPDDLAAMPHRLLPTQHGAFICRLFDRRRDLGQRPPPRPIERHRPVAHPIGEVVEICARAQASRTDPVSLNARRNARCRCGVHPSCRTRYVTIPHLPDDGGTLREHEGCRKAETTGNVLLARDLCKSPLRHSRFAVPPRRRGSRATQNNGLRLRSWTPACAGVRDKAVDRDLRRGLACAVGWPLAIANPALPRQKRLLSLLQSESIYVALKVGDRPARNRIHPLPPALYGC